jgi:hypothetical protein
MSHYTVLNSAGATQWSFRCPDEQDADQSAPPGMFLRKELGPPAQQPMPEPPPPEPAYVRERRLAYPSVAQQLDWLWQAMDAGQLPKIEPMYGQIKAIRLRFPKSIDPKDHGKTTDL